MFCLWWIEGLIDIKNYELEFAEYTSVDVYCYWSVVPCSAVCV